jgi:hypothetical protein
MFPTANFVIYHSGIFAGTGNLAGSTSASPFAALSMTPTENVPFPGYKAANTPSDWTTLGKSPLTGVNQLIQSLLAAGVISNPDNKEPFKAHNVYAEMGTAWGSCMRDTNQAQHYIGKLLKYLGPDNICWGTDCILSGSPQSQIMAFQAFQITPAYQQKYGYPALTPEIKAKIFGLNAAKIYHVDPTAARCKANANTFSMMKKQLDGEIGPNRWAVKGPLGPLTPEEFWGHAREMWAKGVPG